MQIFIIIQSFEFWLCWFLVFLFKF